MNKLRTGLALAAVLVGVSCTSNTPSGPGTIQNALLFTRSSDQSVLAFSNAALLYVWCGEWEEGAIPAQSLHIAFGGPDAADPTWSLRAVVADVSVGVPLTFPNTFIFDQPKNVDFFVNDSLDNPKNECSTQDIRSSGSITFQQLQCLTGGVVQFSINAEIGSEFGNGPSVNVVGTFQAIVGQPPI